MAGVYHNDHKQFVTLKLANNLVKKFITAKGDTLIPLPQQYYSFPRASGDITKGVQITIPKGKLNGYIHVQLSNKFLKDSLSYKLKYVLPLKIMSTSLDTVLSGKPAKGVVDPKLTDPSDWKVEPKNYVLYAIKYINKMDGFYFLKGRDITKNFAKQPIDTVVYRKKFITQDGILRLNTIGRHKVKVVGELRRSNISSPGSYTLILNNNNNSITVTGTNKESSKYKISGQGKYVPKGGEFGGQKRVAIYLQYSIRTASTIHTVVDTLVQRGRGIKFQTFQPKIF